MAKKSSITRQGDKTEKQLVAKVKQKLAAGKAAAVKDREAAELDASVVELKGGNSGAVAKAATVRRPISLGGTAPHGMVKAGPGTGKTFTNLLGVVNVFRDQVVTAPKQEFLTNKLQARMSGPKSVWRLATDMLGFEPKPSKEQQAIWDFIAEGRKPQSIRYMAFNNTIVREFDGKYRWLVEALGQLGVDFQFSTIHSLGNKACRAAYKGTGWKWVNKFKTKDLLAALWQKDLNEVWKEEGENIKAIGELVNLCKLTLAGWSPENNNDGVGSWEGVEDSELETLAATYGIEGFDPGKVFTAVNSLLQQSRDPDVCRKMIDFSDMLWLPVVNGLRVEQSDLMLPDEWQDACRASQEIALRAGRRIVCVGDERQAIYGFAGADTESMSRMSSLLLAGSGFSGGNNSEDYLREFPLTETRRCGKAIVAEALARVNALPHSAGKATLTAHASNPEGVVRRMKYAEAYGGYQEVSGESNLGYLPGDMVLCRTNAPIVGLAFKLLKDKRPVQIQGRPIGADFKRMVKMSKCKDVTCLLEWIDKYEQTQIERLRKRRNVDEEAIVIVQDRCIILRGLCDGAFDMKAVYKNIDELDALFNGKDGEEEVAESKWDKRSQAAKLPKERVILLSSGHRAKGLESKRVFILRPDLLPHPMAKTAWAKEQESNLIWVMVTRAIEELVYVDGKASDGPMGEREECE